MFEVTTRDGTAFVVVNGKLGRESAHALLAVIDGVLATRPRCGVVLDLAGVGVLDTVGAAAVHECCQRATAAGAAIRVSDPSELVRRLAEVTANTRVAVVDADRDRVETMRSSGA